MKACEIHQLPERGDIKNGEGGKVCSEGVLWEVISNSVLR